MSNLIHTPLGPIYTETTGIPGVRENIIHSILSVPILGGATAGFLLGFMLT
jgi:hypothetical protein